MFFLSCCYDNEPVDETPTINPLTLLRPNAESQLVSQAINELAGFIQNHPQTKLALDLHNALQSGKYTNVIEQLVVAQHSTFSVARTNVLNRRQNPNSEIFLNIFQLLAQHGCLNALLISIVTGHCDPLQYRVFALLAEGNSELKTFLQAEWEKLLHAPRSPGVRDSDGVEKANLEKVLTNPTFAELSFTYLAYRFLQEEHLFIDKDTYRPISTKNKSFYANCINHLLQNCWDKPQPALVQLLCLCDVDIVMILTPATKNKIREHMRSDYPAGETFICGGESVENTEVQRAETRLVQTII